MSRWFRFYDEALDDPKVQKLPCEDFRGWVNLLCLASRHEGKLPSIEDISYALRADNIGAISLLDRLVIAGLIDKVKGGAIGWCFAPHNWAKRQYKSDTSTERVKRFRERSETVSGNAPDTDTDTEQIQSRTEPPIVPRWGTALIASHFVRFWEVYPPRCGTNSKAKALEKFGLLLKTGLDPSTIISGAERYAVHCLDERKINTEFVQQAVTWLNQKGWENEYVRSARNKNTFADGFDKIEQVFAEHDRRERLRKDGGENDLLMLPGLREGTG